MNIKIKEFCKKNVSLFHIIGIVLGIFLSILYWHKKGQFSDNILKNNIFLISIWGMAIGYITLDLVKNAYYKNKKQ